MDKLWHRGVIIYPHNKGIALKDIHADMVALYGDTASSYETVKKWTAHINMGKKSLIDDDRCG